MTSPDTVAGDRRAGAERILRWMLLAAGAAASIAGVVQQIGADSLPGAAFGMVPGRSAALVYAGEEDLARGALPAAAASARRALDLSPLNTNGLTLLARVGQAQGDDEGARRALAVLAKSGYRDTQAQYLLAGAAADRGAWREVAERADVMLRQNAFRPALHSFLQQIAADPQGRREIVRVLGERPPWRKAFLQDAARRPELGDMLADLLIDLRRSPAPPTVSEISVALTGMAARRQAMPLRRLYDTFSLRLAPVYADADFSRLMKGDDSARLFGWRTGDDATISVGVEPLPGNDRRTGLNVSASETGGEIVVRKFVVLPAGDVDLRWRRLVPDRGGEAGPSGRLRWIARCGEDARQVPSTEPVIAGKDDEGLEALRQTLHVPAQQCSFQELLLEASPGGEINEWVSRVEWRAR